MEGPATFDPGTAIMKPLLLSVAAIATLSAFPAWAIDAKTAGPKPASAADAIPAQLDETQRTAYRAIFTAIHDQKWLEAKLLLATTPTGPLHLIAAAELVTAKGSPKATLEELSKLLAEAPDLPEAEQIARLAKARGMVETPTLPFTQALSWTRGAPARTRLKSTRSDLVAADLALRMQPLIKEDRAVEAQAMLEATEGLSPEALTEWQHKVAWIYFLCGDDANARVMAGKARVGSGDWAIQADWITGLAAWRQGDYAGADAAFSTVAGRTSDVELRAAGLFWAARAAMAGGHPEKIATRLKSAAQYDETFYGLLARQSLGIRQAPGSSATAKVALDWQTLSKRGNIRVAAALTEIGETDLADTVLKREARIGDPASFPALLRIAAALDLPATQLWLAHNPPVGAPATVAARYPAPNWTPDGGWRVDKALVFAHTLQESSFRTNVVSPAGAYGLMQIRPGAAADIGRLRGIRADRAALTRPSTNMEVGQSYLEQLRDQASTGGLLPKVIAAYNAGPVPVDQWNAIVRDGGDPLLYIESIPYWETRGYVVTVLRNYWMYEREIGKPVSTSRSALAQGLWPRFPGLPGAASVRVAPRSYPPVRAQPVVAASAN